MTSLLSFIILIYSKNRHTFIFIGNLRICWKQAKIVLKDFNFYNVVIKSIREILKYWKTMLIFVCFNQIFVLTPKIWSIKSSILLWYKTIRSFLERQLNGRTWSFHLGWWRNMMLLGFWQTTQVQRSVKTNIHFHWFKIQILFQYWRIHLIYIKIFAA